MRHGRTDKTEKQIGCLALPSSLYWTPQIGVNEMTFRFLSSHETMVYYTKSVTQLGFLSQSGA